MAFDTDVFGSKLRRYREQFLAIVSDVSAATGIPSDVLAGYEDGLREPTGDDVLIIADYYKCDYKFFLSNEMLAPFEQTETLFRMHGQDLTAEDRWAIQEFLFLCECEEFLASVVPALNRKPFGFRKRGSYFKQQGIDAANALRAHLGYQKNQVGMDVFGDLRTLGLHVFRRQLSSSKISGVFVSHPFAGRCILVNFSEDIYRQRFTAAHEAGHAILDDGKDVNISFEAWNKKDLSEIRANNFASQYLMPSDFLRTIPDAKSWSNEKLLDWAGRLKVNTSSLSIALKDAGLIDDATVSQLKMTTLPPSSKVDAELPISLSSASRSRKLDMLKRGLSKFYVDLCFRAYRQGDISAGRLAEMLLVSSQDIHTVAVLFGESLAHVN